jgi:serralysin
MSNIMAKLNTWLCLALAGMLAFSLFGVNGVESQAYSTNWQKGVSFQSRGTEDFASADFQKSVLNATTLGVNHISLVVTYYQYGRNDSNLYRGWNTASDAALTAGTNYAKSLGLQVSYKLFVESNDGWRAYIQPSNKAQWFQQYSGIAVGLGKVAQASGAEMIVLGTEMVGIAAADQDPANTQYWYNLIAAVRSVYAGQLTYGGNWGGAYDEKNNIKFWDALDFIGVSAYFEPGRAGAYDAASIKNFWSGIDKNDLGPLSAKWGKEIIFTEVGYRSTDGSLDRPWEYGDGGNYNSYNQEVAYEGLLGYFAGCLLYTSDAADE